ncbi:MAG: hypothetical protein ACI8X5_000688 [Planctomycetota bacterium]|jgi:hypothetical protein
MEGTQLKTRLFQQGIQLMKLLAAFIEVSEADLDIE